MGGLTKKPKAPAPSIVYMPSPQPTQTPPQQTEKPPESTVSEEPAQREKNLLARGRSRIGTVLTGFRGFLMPVESNSTRKTLLGE